MEKSTENLKIQPDSENLKIQPDKDMTKHNSNQQVTLRSQAEWQETRANVAQFMDSISTQAAYDVATGGIPGNLKEAVVTGAKTGAAVAAKSDALRDSATGCIVHPGQHKLVPAKDPETPTKADNYAPWQ